MNMGGTKLMCSVCRCQVMVTEGGTGTIMCDGKPMEPASGLRPAAEATPGPQETVSADGSSDGR
jgi:hypothetical protein